MCPIAINVLYYIIIKTNTDTGSTRKIAHRIFGISVNRKPDETEVRGRVNKSMEDSPDDRDRRPYTITTNGGRTNPGMDNSFDSDDNPRDPYLAQDGTDIRGSNAMLGSAV
ncbi:hypothetical protein SNE40_016360 [Patella caerulea]|uniref:Uncharacterized protein n=1 Tax=Patella caerulea TaxID=87958 RepID=A0AAN8J9T1_PATCE